MLNTMDASSLHHANHSAAPSGLSFRVRAGPGSINSSSGAAPQGWLPHGVAPQEEDEEELLRQELKKAKKKQKQQERLQQWAKEKEDKAQAAMKVQEEEKRAMQEAGKK
jgi:hypothetical protein